MRQSSSNSPFALCEKRKCVSVHSNESIPDVKMIHLHILTRTGLYPLFWNGMTDQQNKTILSSGGDLNFRILSQAISHVALIVTDITAEVGLSLKQGLCHVAVHGLVSNPALVLLWGSTQSCRLIRFEWVRNTWIWPHMIWWLSCVCAYVCVYRYHKSRGWLVGDLPVRRVDPPSYANADSPPV